MNAIHRIAAGGIKQYRSGPPIFLLIIASASDRAEAPSCQDDPFSEVDKFTNIIISPGSIFSNKYASKLRGPWRGSSWRPKAIAGMELLPRGYSLGPENC